MMLLGLLVKSLAPPSSIRLVEILEIWAGNASGWFWALDYLSGHCYNVCVFYTCSPQSVSRCWGFLSWSSQSFVGSPKLGSRN